MKENNEVWIIDDDKSIRWVLDKALSQDGFETKCFDSAEGVLPKIKSQRPSAIISDIRMPGIDGLELLEKIHERHPDLPVIIMTAHSDLESAVSSYQGGAFEYLPKPFDTDEATALIKRAMEQSKEDVAKVNADNSQPLPEIIGEAPAMQEVFRAIGRLAQSNITVLINGQSGTGKELVAKALHKHSPRSEEAFIAINMAAIPKDLVESELFGHEKGSFTGAGGQRKGRFEQADGGTLFLDEIGDMPLDSQTRLLRVLADGEFYRVGGHVPVKVNVRIIAATHQNLEDLTKAGKFREDLFHRLNVIRMQLPTLAERREDVPQLANFFLEKAAKELEVEKKVLVPEAEEFLSGLSWPGNVRQLENLCRWFTVMASGKEIQISDMPSDLKNESTDEGGDKTNKDWQTALYSWADNELLKGRTAILEQATPEFERVMIEIALKHTAGRKREASELLGWGRNTLTRKIKELSLDSFDE